MLSEARSNERRLSSQLKSPYLEREMNCTPYQGGLQDVVVAGGHDREHEKETAKPCQGLWHTGQNRWQVISAAKGLHLLDAIEDGVVAPKLEDMFIVLMIEALATCLQRPFPRGHGIIGAIVAKSTSGSLRSAISLLILVSGRHLSPWTMRLVGLTPCKMAGI